MFLILQYAAVSTLQVLQHPGNTDQQYFYCISQDPALS